ncbi:hypothetical protein [Desulfosporosinus sp. SB140]|uniref:hypothetical protein n=1 Tax=Desulfosporosinus paludis TaxID=3115649 RepID=UPI00388D4C9B
MPSRPGEKIDVAQTKIYKRQKLAQFRIKISLVTQDIHQLLGIKRTNPMYPFQKKETPWETLKLDVAAAGNTFVEFWGLPL